MTRWNKSGVTGCGKEGAGLHCHIHFAIGEEVTAS